jgi:hypothetical protein
MPGKTRRHAAGVPLACRRQKAFPVGGWPGQRQSGNKPLNKICGRTVCEAKRHLPVHTYRSLQKIGSVIYVIGNKYQAVVIT